MTATGSLPPGPCRPGRTGARSAGASRAAAGSAASIRRTAAGTISAGRAGSIGERASVSAVRTWSPSTRSSPHRRRASATRASSTADRLLAGARCRREIARDRRRVLLLRVPVAEGVRLDRLDLIGVRRGVLLLEDLEEVQPVAGDVDDVAGSVDRGRGDRLGQLVVELAGGDPADLAAGPRMLALGVIADEVGERRS